MHISQVLKYNTPVVSEMEDTNFKVVNNLLLTNRKNTKDSMSKMWCKNVGSFTVTIMQSDIK